MPFQYASGAPAVGTPVSVYASNPTQTAASTADTLFRWGAGGASDQVKHVILGNFTGADLFYAFDQDSTANTSVVYTLPTGQVVKWSRVCTVLHLSSAAQHNINAGPSTIAVEGFA